MSRALRTTTFTEPKVLSDVVKHEYDQSYTRDTGTILSGTGVVTLGRVLGKITASGKWTNYTPGASDGSQNAAAVLLTGSIDATAADMADAILLTRGPSVVALQELSWGAAVTTQNHKDTAIAALKALGIVTRAEA